MKVVVLIFISLILNSLGAISEGYAQPHRVVFEQHFAPPTQEKVNQLREEIRRDLFEGKNQSQDSVLFESVFQMLWKEIYPERVPKLVVEIQDDSIWRFKEFEDGQIMDMELVFAKDGRLIRFDPFRTTPQGTYDQFNFSTEKATMTMFSDQRKQILSYDCFLVTIDVQDSSAPEWSYSLKLYVTDEISLPLHAAIRAWEFHENLFPLEFSIEERYPVAKTTTFTAIEIEK